MSSVNLSLWDSIWNNGLMNLVLNRNENWIDYENDIYLNLEYPWLVELIQFFTTDFDLLSISNDEKYYSTLYHFYKRAYKKLPSYISNPNNLKEKNLRRFLIDIFFECFDAWIQRIPNWVNNHKEELEQLINWDEIKKEYPLAAKSNYHLLHNKTFLESTKKQFLSDYSSKNSDFYEHIMNEIKDVEDPRELYNEFIETLADMETSSNMVEVYIKEYLLFGVFTRFYLDNEKKKNRLDSKSGKIKISSEEKNKIFQKMINTEEIEQVSNINLLSGEEKDIIDSIIQKFDILWEKDKKKIKRYLVRLAVKKKPFKVVQFLENNNLSKLPEWVIWLLDDLMIDIVEDEIEFDGVSNENIDKNINEIDEKNDDISIDVLVGWTNREIFEIFQKDPVSAIIEKAKSCNYDIDNENLLRKQIEPLCSSSKVLRDALLVAILKKTFSRPILKRSWDYSLRVWWSGYRFILRQDEKWKFTIVWFYNHDDYEKVLDGRMW